ncbi:MAG: Sulfite dehydrogenase (quinone), molybdopterin-containing subunit SoeA [Rhodanobacteraceae bacterium]|jgi:anaerobic selenocysteine-containing dehydrogenase|nr:MAG: Sulfite dehydrogenase (quinone), molybdopterin-containing subunit SoeA [Rhodanobacteraceae bacterium]
MPHKNLKLNEPTGDEVKTTTCYMCACRCGIRVHLKNGRVRYIDGNPKHPVNRGVICAKGSSGIMQHYSPARLRKPLLRVGERGAREFREIEWDEALALAAKWLGDIRARNPDELAFFTGRDQSQALTGWWAQQFGTINYAAHGGFCSVNMAAAGMYTFGGSFWEFGEPDWERTRYLMLWGVAEDHDSNPIKLGLGKMKTRGAKIVAINPVRTGYASIADEWVPVNPGTDGLLAGALIHELLRTDRVDFDYLVRYTNAHHLVICDPGAADDGLIARGAQGKPLCAVRNDHQHRHPGESRGPATFETREKTLGPGFRRDDEQEQSRFVLVDATQTNIAPTVVGEYTLPDGRKAVPAFQLIAERFLADDYAPENVSERCGVDAATIRRLAAELAHVAFDEAIELPIAWTDTHGRKHDTMVGRPVAMHAMRGIAAHANGFHTCRTIHLLQILLGAIDTPGSFRYQPPYPKPAPPGNKPAKARKPDGTLTGNPLGYPQSPEDLLVDEHGTPRRIDHAFSWEFPLAAHGLLQSVIRNAVDGNPSKIDTLFLFMANMGWNSSMDTAATRTLLCARDDNGDYRIPHIIYADAYDSETVAFADLVLPDTTYLERYDCISLLDRPISDAEMAADAIRQPVVQPDRDVRPFQDVLLDLGARLKLPNMVGAGGHAIYKSYADYIVRHERAPGVGMLAGWRGTDGSQQGKGVANPDQLQRYIEHGCFFEAKIPEAGAYYRMANRDYLQWAQSMGFVGSTELVTMQLYCEVLQRFRLAAQGHGTVQPPESERARVERYFDPVPMWYDGSELPPPPAGEAARSAERAALGGGDSRESFPHPPFGHLPPQAGEGTARAAASEFPLCALTQRPMFMYHAWGSQNRWLRQIAARNVLYVHPRTLAAHALESGDWAWIASPRGRIRVEVCAHAATAPGTVWTWNAIGKKRGAWKLAERAPEFVDGFLLNHLIGERASDRAYANGDPVTGQAAWFDLKVRLEHDPEPRVPGHRFEPVDD